MLKRSGTILLCLFLTVSPAFAENSETTKSISRSRSGGSASTNVITAKKSTEELEAQRAMIKNEAIEEAALDNESPEKKKVTVYRSRSGGSAMMNYRKTEK